MFITCPFLLLIMATSIPAEKGQRDFYIDFQQKDYNLNLYRIEVARFDKNYVNLYKITTFKYNRTCTAFNMTIRFHTDAGKLQVVVQAYKFLSNEFRVFPMRVQYSFCRAIAQHYAGLGNWKCGNFTGCPLLQGQTYHMCNFIIDPSKLPPRIPSGDYMTEYQFVQGDTEVALTRSYGLITRPEV